MMLNAVAKEALRYTKKDLAYCSLFDTDLDYQVLSEFMISDFGQVDYSYKCFHVLLQFIVCKDKICYLFVIMIDRVPGIDGIRMCRYMSYIQINTKVTCWEVSYLIASNGIDVYMYILMRSFTLIYFE